MDKLDQEHRLRSKLKNYGNHLLARLTKYDVSCTTAFRFDEVFEKSKASLWENHCKEALQNVPREFPKEDKQTQITHMDTIPTENFFFEGVGPSSANWLTKVCKRRAQAYQRPGKRKLELETGQIQEKRLMTQGNHTSISLTVPIDVQISVENMVGLSESTKCGMINKVFEDAYKSPLSIIIIYDIECILEFVNIGPRFSNLVLQTLLVLTKRILLEGRKLLIIGTTSMRSVMDSMDVLSAFNVSIDVPLLDPTDMLEFLKGLEVFTSGDEKKAVEFLDTERCQSRNYSCCWKCQAKEAGGKVAQHLTFSKGKIDLSSFEECYNDLS